MCSSGPLTPETVAGLFDVIDQGVLVYDRDLIVTYYNASFPALLGIPAERLTLGEPFQDWVRISAELGGYGDDGSIDERVRERMDQARTFAPILHDCPVPGGRFLEMRGFPLADGQYITTYTDITERKLLELEYARFKTALEHMPFPLTINDKQGRYLLANEAFEAWYGQPPKDLLGKTADDLPITDEERALRRRMEGQVLEFGITAYREQIKDLAYGDKRHVLVAKFPIRGTGGEISGFASISQDLTDLEKSKTDLQAAKEELERANRAKSEFLASMSHELRTPLNTVLGYGQMLELDLEQTLTDNQKDYVNHIISSGSHILDLVNDILDLARIDADRLSVHPETFAPEPVVRESVEHLSLMAADRNVTLKMEPDGLRGVEIRSDKVRFRQILINLISNAIKYNKPDGQVRISGETTDAGYFRLAVADTGIGIPEQKNADLFTLFHRVSHNPEHAVDGMGIGLFVSKMLIDRLAGSIDFESTEDVGSTFWIDIPLASNDSAMIWTDSLRVGVDVIDRDHQTLCALVNKAGQPDLPPHELAGIVRELVDYTAPHFRREEAVLEACAHPDLDAHRDQHQRMEAEVRSLVDAWRQSGANTSPEDLRLFLCDWWRSHILDVDMSIQPHTIGKELEIERRLAEMGL
jgi:hemerythrin-like metal-binding protein/PAS domain S-box-containing protein